MAALLPPKQRLTPPPGPPPPLQVLDAAGLVLVDVSISSEVGPADVLQLLARMSATLEQSLGPLPWLDVLMGPHPHATSSSPSGGHQGGYCGWGLHNLVEQLRESLEACNSRSCSPLLAQSAYSCSFGVAGLGIVYAL